MQENTVVQETNSINQEQISGQNCSPGSGKNRDCGDKALAGAL